MREPSSIVQPHVPGHSQSSVVVTSASVVQQTAVETKVTPAAPAAPATPVEGEGSGSGVAVAAVVLVIVVGGAGALRSGGNQGLTQSFSAQKFEMPPPVTYQVPKFVQAEQVPLTPPKVAYVYSVQSESLPVHAQLAEVTTPSSSIASTVPQGELLSVVSTTVRAEEIASLLSRAQPKILDHLKARIGKATQADIEKTLSSDLINVIEKAARHPESGITFEAMTGKLKVDSSKFVKGVKVTGGEVNVYKVTAVLGGAILACTALTEEKSTKEKSTKDKSTKNKSTKNKLSECITAALAKVKATVAKEMLPATDAKDARNE